MKDTNRKVSLTLQGGKWHHYDTYEKHVTYIWVGIVAKNNVARGTLHTWNDVPIRRISPYPEL